MFIIKNQDTLNAIFFLNLTIEIKQHRYKKSLVSGKN